MQEFFVQQHLHDGQQGLNHHPHRDEFPKHKQLMAHSNDIPVLKDLENVIAHAERHVLLKSHAH